MAFRLRIVLPWARVGRRTARLNRDKRAHGIGYAVKVRISPLAEVVYFPVDCVSHSAAEKVKKLR